MKRFWLGICISLCVPMLAYAADSGAGFASQSVFLSRSSVAEGETVFIYASVTNDSSTVFSGKVTFSESGKQIGSVAVSLAAGEARVVSISWKPTAGSHTISAQLEDGSGTSVATVATESSTFAIAPKPTAAMEQDSKVQDAAAVQLSTPIQKSIASFSPQVASVTAPILSTIDSARQVAADALEGQITQTQPKLPGEVLGAQTQRPGSSSPSNKIVNKPQNATGWAMAVVWTLYFYVLTILHSVVTTVAFFYPLVAILFVWGLYKLYRKMTSPSY